MSPSILHRGGVMLGGGQVVATGFTRAQWVDGTAQVGGAGIVAAANVTDD
jgi:hypothetical protein